MADDINDELWKILSRPFKLDNSVVEYGIPRQEIAVMTAEIKRAFEKLGYKAPPQLKEGS